MTTEHLWKTNIFLPKPTWCDICHKFISGITVKMQDAACCTCCKMVSHRKCTPNHTECEMKLLNDRGGPGGVVSPGPVDGIKAMAEVLFDFPPENERELKLGRGDKVEIFQISGEWWYGAIVLPNGQHGNEGFFPGSYVKKLGQWELAPSDTNLFEK